MTKLFSVLAIMTVCGVALTISCDCDTRTYKVVDLAVIEQKGELVKNRDDKLILNFDLEVELVAKDTISYNLVGFKFNTKSQALSLRSTGSIFPQAVACDHNLLVPTQTISKVTITSTEDYLTPAKTYSAGDDLGKVFGLNNLGPDATLLGDILYDDFPMYFILTSAPSGIQLHQFTFIILLDDKTEFTTQTEPLYIQP